MSVASGSALHPPPRSPAACLTLIAAPSAQSSSWTRQPRDEEQATELLQYHSLVTAFRSGDETVADGIALWPRKRLVDIVELLPPALQKVQAWDPLQFKAAAMMHTTAGLHLLQTPDRADQALLQFQLATRVLQRGRESVRSFVGPWHTAVARVLLAEPVLTDADQFLKHAREAFPSDPSILFMSGLLSEYLAGEPSFERTQRVAAVMSQVDIGGMLERNLARRTERLQNARRWLRQAQAGQPENAEISLHLGRVEMLRQQDGEALPLLGQVEGSAAAGTSLRYLAALFTGGLHERSGRLEEAVAAYRRALALLPMAQSATVALSEALRRAGRGEESRTIMQDGLRSPREVVDPWWIYLIEDRNTMRARIDRIRSEWRQ